MKLLQLRSHLRTLRDAGAEKEVLTDVDDEAAFWGGYLSGLDTCLDLIAAVLEADRPETSPRSDNPHSVNNCPACRGDVGPEGTLCSRHEGLLDQLQEMGAGTVTCRWPTCKARAPVVVGLCRPHHSECASQGYKLAPWPHADFPEAD